MAVLAMKAGAVDFLEHPLRDHDVLEAVGRRCGWTMRGAAREAPLQRNQGPLRRHSPRANAK